MKMKQHAWIVRFKAADDLEQKTGATEPELQTEVKDELEKLMDCMALKLAAFPFEDIEIMSLPEGSCCCCGHQLENHVDEGDGWRCHNLGPDGYQCECWLRKGRYIEGLQGYDFSRRFVQLIFSAATSPADALAMLCGLATEECLTAVRETIGEIHQQKTAEDMAMGMTLPQSLVNQALDRAELKRTLAPKTKNGTIILAQRFTSSTFEQQKLGCFYG